MGFFSGSPEIFTEISPEQIVQLFKEEGFPAEIVNTSSGKPFIRFKVEGYNSGIYFYSESKEKQGYYHSIQFSAGFRDKISVEKANQWNRERRYIKVYSDSDGELGFERDVSLEGGVTKKYLLERISDWRAMFSIVLAFAAS